MAVNPKAWTMQTPPHLPYQAYRSKRHSRNTSANSQQQPGILTPNVSPPPPSRPLSVVSNGYTSVNGNASAVGHGSSEPAVPSRRDFARGADVNVSPQSNGTNGTAGDQKQNTEFHRKINRPVANGNGINATPTYERRRSVSKADVASQLQYENRRITPPPVASSALDHSMPMIRTSVSPAPPSPASSMSESSAPTSQTRQPPSPSPAPRSPSLPLLPNSQTIVVSSPIDIVARTSLVAAADQNVSRSMTGSAAEEPAAGPSSIAVSTSTATGPTSSTTPTPSPHASPRAPRRTSTFRHVPLRPARTPHPSSPLRPAATLAPTHHRGSSSLSRRALDAAMAMASPGTDSKALPQGLITPEMHALRMSDPPSRVSSLMSTPLIAPSALGAGASGAEKDLPGIPALELSAGGKADAPQVQPSSRPPSAHARRTPTPGAAPAPEPVVHNPPPRASSLAVLPPSAILAQPQAQSTLHPSRASTTPTPSSTTPSPSTPSPRASAPYRPGFQPKGVYRPRTDEFIELRRTRKDDGRVEQARLERRLEKLINLHFPHPNLQREKDKEKTEGGGRGKEAANGNGKPMAPNRRASSFFDLDLSSIKGKSASELWKGVIQTQASGGKADIRAAEQVITPWEDDAAVSQCPICTSSFHPITNRKHHCRLCGRIICSLPVKYPQRPQTCSVLFVADPLTGEIEEVGEGVDYGVRRRTSSTVQANGKGKGRDDFMGLSDDEKFLRGVRICRDCRPVLLRRQYIQDVHRIPLFSRLYDAFIALEKEIEEALPQFQELVISISHDERPSPEASAARKRLLEAFAQYDALAKRIRKLPCPGGPGSSHDRVQQAILGRANVFLQKHMFPLQALPKPRKSAQSSTPSSPGGADAGGGQIIDPDSELAKALQPLLEQEALLESFVEEAKAHRKFEDVQTLKANLKEIRAEIDRILANVEGHLRENRSAPGGRVRKP